MIIIIIGTNRAEQCTVKMRDLDKHFFQTRGQLYKVYPDGLTRMRIVDADGYEQESEEVLVYAENAIEPYHPRHVDYSQDRILAEIDEHKLMTKGTSPGRLLIHKVLGIMRDIVPYFGLILAGIVVLWGMIS